MQLELRLANEKYLREHPELMQMLSLFCERVYQKNTADVRTAAVEFFTQENLNKTMKFLNSLEK